VAQVVEACAPLDDGSSRATQPATQAPLDAAEIVEERVTFTSRGDELRGVVQRPPGEATGKRAAVLILGDTGPMDIDGHVKGSLGIALPVEVPIYAHLASDLARRGFVVMRYAKRTCTTAQSSRCPYPTAHVTKHRETMTAVLREDARQALASLKNRRDVDVTRVAIVGHGQGAEIALGMAGEASAIAALSPPAHGPAGVTLHQLERSAEYARQTIAREGDTAMGDLMRRQLGALELERAELERGMEGLASASASDVILGVPVSAWRGLGRLHEDAMRAVEQSPTPVLTLFAELDTMLPEDTPEVYKRAVAKHTGGRGARAVEVLSEVTHDFVVLAEDREPVFSEEVAVAVSAFLLDAGRE